MTRTLYSIALSLLMCADGLALEIDCTRSIESEGPYAALDFNLREVVDLGPANDAEVLKTLRSAGVAAQRVNDSIWFPPGVGHYLNRLARRLDALGSGLFWRPAQIRQDASCAIRNFSGGLWEQKPGAVLFSTREILKMIRSPLLDPESLRHELVHIQNLLNRQAGRGGLFHGYIEGAHFAGYEELFTFDEVPAYLESLLATREEIDADLSGRHRLVAAALAERRIDEADFFRNLRKVARYSADFYSRLGAYVDSQPFGSLHLVRDDHGIYFRDQEIPGGERFSLSLTRSRSASLDRATVQNELKVRSVFFAQLVGILELVEARTNWTHSVEVDRISVAIYPTLKEMVNKVFLRLD